MSIEHFSIYDLDTGNIRQWGTCAPGEWTLIEVEAGHGIVAGPDGPWTSKTHYVVDGAPVAYTEQQRADKSTKPKRWMIWSNASMSWVDRRNLAEAKKDKLQELAEAWTDERKSGVNIGGKIAPTDADSWTRYLAIKAMAEDSGTWIDVPVPLANGNFELLTKTKAGVLWEALKSMERDLLVKLHAKINAVKSAATIDDVEAITWN